MNLGFYMNENESVIQLTIHKIDNLHPNVILSTLNSIKND